MRFGAQGVEVGKPWTDSQIPANGAGNWCQSPGLRRLVLVLLLMAPAAQAAELRIYFTAVQKILSQQVFTQDGRKYVKGSEKSKCGFVYIDNPRLGENQGRLNMKMRVTARTGWEIFGACFGPGEAFDLAIDATPFYQGGAIRMTNISVATVDRGSWYSRRIRDAFARNFPKYFEYKVLDDLKNTIEKGQPKGPFTLQLGALQVPRIRVTNDAVILDLDFSLSVR